MAAALPIAGSIFGGLSARAQAEGQAQVLGRQAARETEIGAINAQEFKKSASAAAATSRAIDPNRDEGVEAQFASEADVQRLRILNNSQVRSSNLITQGKQVRDQGRAKLIGGFLNAGSSLLSSGGGQRPTSQFSVSDTPFKSGNYIFRN